MHMPRVLVTKDLAEQMESCIKETHIEYTKSYKQGCSLPIGGGVACFSGFDSYFSQVIGWGFRTKPAQFQAEIETIESFYHALKHPRVDIELSPYVGNALICFLSERGYRLSEVNNVSVLDLSWYKTKAIAIRELTLRAIKSADVDQWAMGVAQGFGYPEAEEQFIYYAKAIGCTAFGVYEGEKLVAGGSVALHGNVCDLGVTSTLPAYRSQGLQKKLLLARLNHAKKEGVRWASVTTEPGTLSDLNVQKTGFQCAYSRMKMTLMTPRLG